MSTGSTNLAMANSLGISVATIETHVKHIRQKLGIRGRQWIDAALDEKDKNTHSGY
jgi:DNA-binding CsgD family transcriptional regulator